MDDDPRQAIWIERGEAFGRALRHFERAGERRIERTWERLKTRCHHPTAAVGRRE